MGISNIPESDRLRVQYQSGEPNDILVLKNTGRVDFNREISVERMRTILRRSERNFNRAVNVR